MSNFGQAAQAAQQAAQQAQDAARRASRNTLDSRYAAQRRGRPRSLIGRFFGFVLTLVVLAVALVVFVAIAQRVAPGLLDDVLGNLG